MVAAKKKNSSLTFIGSLLLLANVLVIVLLMAGFFAAYIPPDKYWISAFFGLVFPYLFAVNLIFIPIWLFVRKKYVILPLIFVVLCWSRINGYFQIGNETKNASKTGDIRLMSYNVRLFDLYHWEMNQVSRDALSMFRLMKEYSPDLLFIQEYHAGRKGKITILDSIIHNTGLEYNHVSLVEIKGKTQPYGIATFSRWPLISKGAIRFNSNPANVCIYSDIVRNGDTIRIFNIHLESIQLSQEDYLYVNELRTNAEEQEILSKELKSISRKLKNAFIQRAAQAREVADEIAKSPYPVIVCGDFNDTPSSYTYHQISENLIDAFISSGKGMSQTYAGPIPSLRIDYILHDKSKFEANNYTRIRKKYSDHFPITADINVIPVK
ncbi:MAG: endonuclease/exonuclease/phosphatase family protein [Lentimicrobium sp.]|nr:endonuclease/exonuclease/phosphatase family protein [Lentimicrobium sp.]